MAADTEAGRPLLAATCVGRLRSDVPASGFFLVAEALGPFGSAPDSPPAHEFHLRELDRLLSRYRR